MQQGEADLYRNRAARNGKTPKLWESALLALAFGFLYLLFRQENFYKLDGPGFVLALERGVHTHYAHYLYLPILHGLRAFAVPLGLTDFQLAGMASALGTALGLFFLHRAAVCARLSRADSLLLLLLVGTCPSLFFFATVVEVHGVFLAFVGLAWWMACRAMHAPGLVKGVVLGAATGLAGVVHGSGQILPVLLLSWMFCRRLDADRTDELCSMRLMAQCLAAAAGTHLAVFLLSPAILVAFGLHAEAGSLFRHMQSFLKNPPGFSALPMTFLHEWLLPYLPISLLSLLAFRRRSFKWTRLAFAANLGLYMVLSLLLLPGGGREWGAYQAPFCYSAAYLALSCLRRPLLVGTVAFSLLLSIMTVLHHDRAELRPHYVEDLALATSVNSSFYLLGSHEVNDVLQDRLSLDFLPISDSLLLLAKSKSKAQETAVLSLFDQTLAAKARAGKAIYLGAEAWSLIENGEFKNHVLRHHLEEGYTMTRVQSGSFRARRLQRN